MTERERRKRFEAWATENGWSVECMKTATWKYAHSDVQGAWEAWDACADACAERVEKAARWAAERAWDFAFMPTIAPKARDAIIEAVVQDAIGVQYER